MAEKEAVVHSNNLYHCLSKHVEQTYNKLNCHFFLFLLLLIIIIPNLLLFSSYLQFAKFRALSTLIIYNSNVTTLLLSLSTIAILTSIYLIYSPRPVYLVEFSCYKPSDTLKITRETFMRQFQSPRAFTDDSVAFQRRMLERSGLGQSTYLPKSLQASPMNPCMAMARDETTTVMFGAIDSLLATTGIKPKEIAILVTNCSLYGPTPSLSAVIVNHYGLREDVKSYNLGGIGCSAGLISIDLAKQLLQVHPNSYALVLSTENMTLSPYFGNNRSMLVTNSLFRMGGAAALLSNRPSDRCRSKYQLLHTVRTHKGATDRCFSCINQEDDDEGILGVSLSKDLMAVAGDTLKANITTLGPLVLPLSEQLNFLISLLKRKVLKMKKMKPYIPDFKLAFEHFCIHAGGRAVLDEIERNLELSEWHMEPSRMMLYRFGNTSSSSLWYELAYCEAQGRIRRGDRLWQIAFGSGFKCNSAVWRALRTIDDVVKLDAHHQNHNPWADEIHDFPVHVPKVVSIKI